MKKCQPGVICIENVTLVFIVISVGIIGTYLWKNNPLQTDTTAQALVVRRQENVSQDYYDGGGDIRLRPNVAYNNRPRDVLLNPYAPPLRDERYLVPDNARYGGGIPINTSTSIDAVDAEYRQVGILTPSTGSTEGKILPLMGRPLFVSRDKWQYYTMSDQRNSIKLPISRNGRSAMTEYGVDKLFNGDSVYIEGYNQAFKTTIYDIDVIKYLPFL